MKTVFLVSSTEIIKLESESYILAEALKKRGIQTEIVCWDDPNVDWNRSDLSIIRSTSDYAWKVDEFLEWVKKVEEVTVLWNPGDVIRWNHHKRYLLDLQDAGVPIPPTVFVPKESNESLKHHIKDTGWDEIVIKPAITVGGFGLKRYAANSAEAEEHLNRLIKLGWRHSFEHITCFLSPGDVLIQQFLPEIIESGEASLFYYGGEFAYSVMKKVKPGEILAHPGYGATVTLYDASPLEREVADAALVQVGCKTEYARIDMALTRNGPLIMELELIEPWLFIGLLPGKVNIFADQIASHLNR
jgi:glutathione synthase/RimK-type ligase-like ATP-grasp enzyme